MGIVFAVVPKNQTYNMHKFITLAILFLALTASADDHANDTVTCTAEDSDTTSYDACLVIQTTCVTAVEVCQTAGGSLEDACIETATGVLETALAAVSFTDCECEIECSSSSMVLLSVFALFARFLF